MAIFFFSYARANIDAYLETFEKDLKRLLRGRIGGSAEGLFFIDRETVEPGSEWPQQIAENLRTCQIFFSIESPDYFQSVYCGKEWSAFHQRLGKPALPLHIRIGWLPIPKRQLEALPQAVQDIQDTRTALGDNFEQLVRALPGEPYQTALTKLVDLVVSTWEGHSLPPTDDILELSEIESAFLSPGQAEVRQKKTAGVRHVRFGVVAGAQEEVLSFREPSDSYGGVPVDWMPFHPENSWPIGPFAQGVAASQKLTSHFLGLDGSLKEELADAEKARNLVIFLVDPWALGMKQHEALFRSYEDMHFLSCSLLIPWPTDPQTRSSRDKLVDLVRATLAKTALREPGSYREEIDSIDRLESELIKAITNATARILDLVEVTRRVETVSGRKIAMPLLTGPAGGANDAR